MPRENAEVRGRRLLVEGRLVVRHVDAHEVRATIRGDSGEVHEIGYRPGGWYCPCPARTRCAHLVALLLVVLRPGSEVA